MKLATALGVFGVILLVFSIVWITVIEPDLEKLPTDLDESYTADAQITDTFGLLGFPSKTIDIVIEHRQQAIDSDGDVLTIKEQVTPDPAIPGTGILEPATLQMSVDRDSREFLQGYEGDDRQREGLWAYPVGVKKQDYAVWSETAGSAPIAHFDSEGELDGLDVYNFVTDEKDLPYDFDLVPGLPIPLVMDFRIDEQIEPHTGITVNIQSELTAKVWITSDLLAMLDNPAVLATLPDNIQPVVNMLPDEVGPEGMKLPVLTVKRQYSDETVAEKVSDAKDYKTQLLWATKYGLWLGIGFGVVLLLVGGWLFLRARSKSLPADIN